MKHCQTCITRFIDVFASHCRCAISTSSAVGHRTFGTFVIVVSLWFGSGAAYGAVVNISTGVTPNGVLLSASTSDPRWSVVNAPTTASIGAAKVINRHPWWFDPSPSARWLGPPNSTGGTTELAGGNYTYRTTFKTMAGNRYILVADLNSDNNLVSVKLNNRVIPASSGTTDFRNFFPVPIAVADQTYFAASGTNTLEITLKNSPEAPTQYNPQGKNPSGFVLRGAVYEISSAQASKIPAAIYCWVETSKTTKTQATELARLGVTRPTRSAWDPLALPTSRTWGSTTNLDTGRRNVFDQTAISTVEPARRASKEEVSTVESYAKFKKRRSEREATILKLQLEVLDVYYACVEKAVVASDSSRKDRILAGIKTARTQIDKTMKGL